MQPAEQTQIHKQQYFLDATEAYERAMMAYQDADEALASQKVTVAHQRDILDDMEAEALVNGGVGGKYIDAGTELKRKAQLRLALRDWPEYQTAKLELDDAVRAAASIESQRDRAANEMSLHKRRCDAHVANVARATAVLNTQPTGYQQTSTRRQTPEPSRR